MSICHMCIATVGQPGTSPERICKECASQANKSGEALPVALEVRQLPPALQKLFVRLHGLRDAQERIQLTARQVHNSISNLCTWHASRGMPHTLRLFIGRHHAISHQASCQCHQHSFTAGAEPRSPALVLFQASRHLEYLLQHQSGFVSGKKATLVHREQDPGLSPGWGRLPSSWCSCKVYKVYRKVYRVYRYNVWSGR